MTALPPACARASQWTRTGLYSWNAPDTHAIVSYLAKMFLFHSGALPFSMLLINSKHTIRLPSTALYSGSTITLPLIDG
jgi:hypothetical protein